MKHENLIGKKIPVKISAEHIKGNFFLSFERYLVDQKICIRIVDCNGSPITKLTTNIAETLEDDQFHVKTWSENAGLLESLIKSGHIVYTGKFSQSGYVKAPVCRLAESLVSEEAE